MPMMEVFSGKVWVKEMCSPDSESYEIVWDVEGVVESSE
jgi:hypothetical protein